MRKKEEKKRKVVSDIDGVNNRPADVQVILYDNELPSIYDHDFLLVGFFTHLLINTCFSSNVFL